MSVAERLRTDRNILTVAGRFDAAEAAGFRGRVALLLAEPAPTVRVDLSGVDFLDCGALAEIIRADRDAADRGGALLLVGQSSPVRQLLKLAALERSFTGPHDIDTKTGTLPMDPIRPTWLKMAPLVVGPPSVPAISSPFQHPAEPATISIAAQQSDPAGLTALACALVESRDRLLALQELHRVAPSSGDFASALSEMFDKALELTDSDAVVLLHPPGPGSIGTWAVTAAGSDDATVALEGEVREFATLGQPGPVTGRQGRSVVTLLAADTPNRPAVGFARQDGPAYTTGDMAMIDAATNAIEQMLTLTRLNENGIEQAALALEHQLVSALAQSVLAVPPPVLAGLDLFFDCVPAFDAGGDFAVFMVVDNVVHFAVGDVAGKGLRAAMVMSRAVTAARIAFLTHKPDDAAGTMTAISGELFDYLMENNVFVTAAVGSYQPDSGELFICNAGHSPVLTVVDGTVAAVPASMPPLGVSRAARGRTHTLLLGPNDLLVVGSDGLAEQENPDRVLFGYDHLEELCAAQAGGGAAHLGNQILAAITRHADGATASDDRTLVILGSHPAGTR